MEEWPVILPGNQHLMNNTIMLTNITFEWSLLWIQKTNSFCRNMYNMSPVCLIYIPKTNMKVVFDLLKLVRLEDNLPVSFGPT